ncbi:MAG TPA: N-acetylmuramoyl-L-alanine amidase [Bacillota bacterium]|nr:N-acetylmuramoyl-L-alanine amidase [Bacillota bacterium]
MIVIDAGHGGSELGSNYGNLREKDLNLKVALKVKSILLSNDYEVIMIRTSDVTYHYNKRWQLANKKKADLFVSIHTNSIRPWAHGAFIMTPSNHDQSSSDNLANKIHIKYMIEDIWYDI